MLLCSTTSVTSKCGNSVAKCFVQLLQLMQQVWQQELKYVGQKCGKSVLCTAHCTVSSCSSCSRFGNSCINRRGKGCRNMGGTMRYKSCRNICGTMALPNKVCLKVCVNKNSPGTIFHNISAEGSVDSSLFAEIPPALCRAGGALLRIGCDDEVR